MGNINSDTQLLKLAAALSEPIKRAVEEIYGVGKNAAPNNPMPDVIDTFRAMANSVPTPAATEPMSRHQFKFTAMVAALIAFAYERGYRLTFGSARSAPGNTPKHSANSLHYDSLAVDLNLFRQINGTWTWMQKTEDHIELGEFWESIGGTWGGRFNDGNHYSLKYQGRW